MPATVPPVTRVLPLDSRPKPRLAHRVSEIPLVRRLDLICLRPDASRKDVERLCQEARQHGCLAVCVPGTRVELAAGLLEGSPVRVSAFIGFPFGTSDGDVKRYEIETAIDAGAQELEVVVNPGQIKDRQDHALIRELRDLREAAEERPVKAILELGLLTPDEVRRAAGLVREAELQFLVTATGCAPRVTSAEDLQELREVVGPELGLKAVGGIAALADALRLLDAGANRLGVYSLTPFLPSE